MRWTLINFWVDCLLMILLLVLVWTGFVVRFVFPSASSAVGWTLWSWSYAQWSDFQFIVLCLFGLTALIHVTLHWSWDGSAVLPSCWARRRPASKPISRPGAATTTCSNFPIA